MSKSLATLCAAFVAAFALAATGAAAQAQAYYLTSTSAVADHHLNILRWPPRNPSFRPCIGKYEKLPAGDFWEGAYIVSEGHRNDPDLSQARIRISVAGSYWWEACRGWSSDLGKYQVRSTLSGHGFSHTILNTFERDPNQTSGRSHLYGNGNYEWGGRIVRYEPDVTEPAAPPPPPPVQAASDCPPTDFCLYFNEDGNGGRYAFSGSDSNLDNDKYEVADTGETVGDTARYVWNNGEPASLDDVIVYGLPDFKGADACIRLHTAGALPSNWWNNIESYRWVTDGECEAAGVIPLAPR